MKLLKKVFYLRKNKKALFTALKTQGWTYDVQKLTGLSTTSQAFL